MIDFIKPMLLLFMLLNPLSLIVYLVELVNKTNSRQFAKVLLQAGLISSSVFIVFMLSGKLIFTHIIQAEFASFKVFGGIVLLIVGIQFVFHGNHAIESLRGDPTKAAGAVAMPIFIGPSTISASMIIGNRLDKAMGVLAILTAVFLSIIVMIILKFWHDQVIKRNEKLVERYIDIAGRITALFVGTISIQMIMSGVNTWLKRLF